MRRLRGHHHQPRQPRRPRPLSAAEGKAWHDNGPERSECEDGARTLLSSPLPDSSSSASLNHSCQLLLHHLHQQSRAGLRARARRSGSATVGRRKGAGGAARLAAAGALSCHKHDGDQVKDRQRRYREAKGGGTIGRGREAWERKRCSSRRREAIKWKARSDVANAIDHMPLLPRKGSRSAPQALSNN